MQCAARSRPRRAAGPPAARARASSRPRRWSRRGSAARRAGRARRRRRSPRPRSTRPPRAAARRPASAAASETPACLVGPARAHGRESRAARRRSNNFGVQLRPAARAVGRGSGRSSSPTSTSPSRAASSSSSSPSASAFAPGSSARRCSSVQAQLVGVLEQLVDPVALRVHLEPVAGVRRDERAPAGVLLHAQAALRRALEHLLELVVVERHAEVVDARQRPLARLDDDVDRAALELGEPVPEARSARARPTRRRPRSAPGPRRSARSARSAGSRACPGSAPRPRARGSSPGGSGRAPRRRIVQELAARAERERLSHALRGVHHVDLVVSSIERSLPFYRDLLGAARLARDQRGRGRARRDDLVPLGPRQLARPPRGADARATAVRPLPGRPAPPRARGRRRARSSTSGPTGCEPRAPRSRAARRSTRTCRGTTRCSSTIPTASSSRSCTSPASRPDERRAGMSTTPPEQPAAPARTRVDGDAEHRRPAPGCRSRATRSSLLCVVVEIVLRS